MVAGWSGSLLYLPQQNRRVITSAFHGHRRLLFLLTYGPLRYSLWARAPRPPCPLRSRTAHWSEAKEGREIQHAKRKWFQRVLIFVWVVPDAFFWHEADWIFFCSPRSTNRKAFLFTFDSCIMLQEKAWLYSDPSFNISYLLLQGRRCIWFLILENKTLDHHSYFRHLNTAIIPSPFPQALSFTHNQLSNQVLKNLVCSTRYPEDHKRATLYGQLIHIEHYYWHIMATVLQILRQKLLHSRSAWIIYQVLYCKWIITPLPQAAHSTY